MTMMNRDTWLAEQFESSRPRLHAVAFRMLGSQAEADDAVQDTWLKLARAETDDVENLGAWLTTVIGRVCLDRLRARRVRNEEAGPAGDTNDLAAIDEHGGPEQQALVADSVGAALLVVLEMLSPAERVAFVLHDVFAVPFEEIAVIVDRSPDATRQLASRARRRVQGADTTGSVDLVRQREVVDAFLVAARGGDFEALVALLDPDVVLQPDQAALAMGSLRATRGAEKVAAALSGGARAAQLVLLDGVAGLAWSPGGRIRGAIEFTIARGRIVAIDVIGDAERLGRLEIVPISD
jgi:RNA polymerase sigma factor (sigma-70 family)